MRRLFLFLLFFPLQALAANGDACTASQVNAASVYSGIVGCVRALDDVTSPSGGPFAFNLAPILNQHPSSICFQVGQTDCPAGTVTIKSSTAQSSALENDVYSAGTTISLDVDSSSPAGRTKRCVNLTDDPVDSDLRIRWTGAGSCTSVGWDLLVYGVKRP